jgi:hypothetical protein
MDVRRYVWPGFAEIHEEVDREHGYDLIEIPPGTVESRAAMTEERLL